MSTCIRSGSLVVSYPVPSPPRTEACALRRPSERRGQGGKCTFLPWPRFGLNGTAVTTCRVVKLAESGHQTFAGETEGSKRNQQKLGTAAGIRNSSGSIQFEVIEGNVIQ
jgi:hypothetical protein